MEWINNIKLFVKSAFSLAVRVVFFTASGLILNWIYGFAVIPAAAGQWESSGEGVAGFFLSIAMNWQIIAALLLFFLAFPVLWFFMGQSFGTTKALRDIFEKHKKPFLEIFSKLMIKLFEKTKITSQEEMKKSFRGLAKHERLPWWYRRLIFFVFDSVELGGVEELLKKNPDLQSQEFKDNLIEVLDAGITENYLSPPWIAFGILLAADIGFMIFVSTAVLKG